MKIIMLLKINTVEKKVFSRLSGLQLLYNWINTKQNGVKNTNSKTKTKSILPRRDNLA